MQAHVSIHVHDPEKQKVLLWHLLLQQLGIVWINKAWPLHWTAIILFGLIHLLEMLVLTLTQREIELLLQRTFGVQLHQLDKEELTISLVIHL